MWPDWSGWSGRTFFSNCRQFVRLVVKGGWRSESRNLIFLGWCIRKTPFKSGLQVLLAEIARWTFRLKHLDIFGNWNEHTDLGPSSSVSPELDKTAKIRIWTTYNRWISLFSLSCSRRIQLAKKPPTMLCQTEEMRAYVSTQLKPDQPLQKEQNVQPTKQEEKTLFKQRQHPGSNQPSF